MEPVKEKYTPWPEAIGLSEKLYLQGLLDTYEGFRLLLEDKDGNGAVFRVGFDSHLAYRNIDEGDRLRSLGAVCDARPAIIYLVEDSEWLKWFKEENQGKYGGDNLFHWAIITPNDWVDVISIEPPKVEELT